MKISIGGLFQALLGSKVSVLSAKSVDAFVDAADDNEIADWLNAMKNGKPTAGNPLNVKRNDKVVTLKIRIGQSEIRQLFKTLNKSQTAFHQEWVEDREVEDAAELLKSEDQPLF